ncbi:ribA/ribD-fused uncharacterized protein [Paenibacillus sp. DS2015]|uniref:NADAR family protein n=1 Tax=Paenibacillus sp. DS2015 TaxID=3373917 RepID=UPI003D1F9E0D
MEKFTFFWSAKSPLSQGYPSTFVIDGNTFNCAEQYMMYEKAWLFGDEDIAHQILAAPSPEVQKQLGRKVAPFNQQMWTKHCKQIVHDGNYEKFTQNEELLSKLLDTKGTTLVEASPLDQIWSVGLAEDDPRIHNRETWQGTNWLGEILTDLREEFLQSKK